MADTKWVKVNIEGNVTGSEQTLYLELDVGLSERATMEAAQDAVNEAIGGWGVEEISANEVPEGER